MNMKELIIQGVFLKPLGPLRGIFATCCTGFVLSSSAFFGPIYMRKPFSFAVKGEKIHIQDPHLPGSVIGHCLLYLECKINPSERLLRAKEN